MRVDLNGNSMDQAAAVENPARPQVPEAPLPSFAARAAIIAIPVIATLGALYYKSQDPAYVGAAVVSVPTLLFSLLAANNEED